MKQHTQYRNAWKCVSCRGWLTYHQVMNSHGRCPLCGFKGPRACTIVEFTEHAIRLTFLPRTRWWRFWESPVSFEEKEVAELKTHQSTNSHQMEQIGDGVYAEVFGNKIRLTIGAIGPKGKEDHVWLTPESLYKLMDVVAKHCLPRSKTGCE